MAEEVGLGEKSAVFAIYFSRFIRLLNHYRVTIPPLPPNYLEGTLLGTLMGDFSLSRIVTL